MDQASLQRIDWVRRMIHVEMYDGNMFCGCNPYEGAIQRPGVDCVPQGAWRDEPHTVQRATCPQCLLRLFMLGDSAQIALAKMGMKIDVHNEEEIH